MQERTWKTIAITALSLILSAIFFLAGGFKLAGAEELAANFERWGFPLWFMTVTGAVELAAAALLLLRKTRFYGAALLVPTMIGAVGTHVAFGEYGATAPSLVLGALAAVVAWSTRPAWLPLSSPKTAPSK